MDDARRRLIPYPLSAARISLSIAPFTFWWPSFTRRHLTETAKEGGETLWWVRFACFEISYSRML